MPETRVVIQSAETETILFSDAVEVTIAVIDGEVDSVAIDAGEGGTATLSITAFRMLAQAVAHFECVRAVRGVFREIVNGGSRSAAFRHAVTSFPDVAAAVSVPLQNLSRMSIEAVRALPVTGQIADTDEERAAFAALFADCGDDLKVAYVYVLAERAK